jgi:hypothetical protein
MACSSRIRCLYAVFNYFNSVVGSFARIRPWRPVGLSGARARGGWQQRCVPPCMSGLPPEAADPGIASLESGATMPLVRQAAQAAAATLGQPGAGNADSARRPHRVRHVGPPGDDEALLDAAMCICMKSLDPFLSQVGT